MNRYLIAFLLPPETERALREYYTKLFNLPCPIRTLHSTFIPPFIQNSNFVSDDIQSRLAQLALPTTQFTFGKPDVFSQPTRQILYTPVIPAKPLIKLFEEISDIAASSIQIDTSAFKQNLVPEYMPHITLNYNFKGPLDHPVAPEISFNLPSIKLLTETNPGIWVPAV